MLESLLLDGLLDQDGGDQMNTNDIENLFLQHGSSKTNNKEFDKSGFVFVKKMIDPKLLVTEVPEVRGQYHYYGDETKFTYTEQEEQVPGSLSRYYYPGYKESHMRLKKSVEEIIGKKLYQTYYYDRFYFEDTDLKKHFDRDACEISVTIHIGTNMKEKWPFWIKNGDGNDCACYLEPGDGVIYKGCERLHWRDPMPYKPFKLFGKKLFSKEDIYYHQAFFHYVLSDGSRAHYAFDKGNN